MSDDTEEAAGQAEGQDAPRSLREHAEAGFHLAEEHLSHVTDKVEALAHDAKGWLEGLADDTRTKVEAVLAEARKKADELAADARQKVEHLIDEGKKAVHHE